MQRQLRKCPGCNKEFHLPKSPNQIFCSVTCKKEAKIRAQTIECIQCGTPTINPRFCSKRCAATYNNLHSDPSRKRGPMPLQVEVLKPKRVPKPKKQVVPRKPKLKAVPEGAFTKLFRNTCVRTGQVFFHYKRLKYHPDMIDTKDDYKRQCAFRFALHRFPKWFDGALLAEHGMYKPPNRGVPNPNGISRDHMVSIADGWKQNIDPKAISHPANCELMLHSANNKKHKTSSISKEDLDVRISQFELIYPNWRIK